MIVNLHNCENGCGRRGAYRADYEATLCDTCSETPSYAPASRQPGPPRNVLADRLSFLLMLPALAWLAVLCVLERSKPTPHLG